MAAGALGAARGALGALGARGARGGGPRRWAAAAGGAGLEALPLPGGASGRLLVVQERGASPARRAEGLRLAETYLGVHRGGGGGAEAGAPEVAEAGGTRRVPATYWGSGTVERLRAACEAGSPPREPVGEVFADVALSAVQVRNLSRELGRPVLDRVGLILAIFGQRARTREARLQVELAALQHRAAMLVRASRPGRKGAGEFADGAQVVSARERGRSGGGGGGLGGGSAGEQELALQRDRLRRRRGALQVQLQKVRQTREVQRQGRRRSGAAAVAVVGYTNAGKSSLMACLTKGAAEGGSDRLFDTLDTAMRRVSLPSGRAAIFSDTVGFISDIPHGLVEAFRSTLEEVAEADLVVHVVDASSPNLDEQRVTVLDVLRGIGVSERLIRGRIEVFNKADLLSAEERAEVLRGREAEDDQGKAYLVSAASGEGLEDFLLEVDKRTAVRSATRQIHDAADRFGGARFLSRTTAKRPGG